MGNMCGRPSEPWDGQETAAPGLVGLVTCLWRAMRLRKYTSLFS